MIELKNIEITFAPGTVIEKQALRGISLTIDEGEFITVIGSNGAGKSTLLNSIAGEIDISSGNMLIDHKDVTAKNAAERAGDVARVFQDPLAGTCSDLTIAENLALAAARGHSRGLQKAVKRHNREEFAELLKTLNLGLENRLDTPMSLLSGGQRQAVSLLMVTLSPSKILLLDEHTAALDPKTADFILDLTQRIVEHKRLTTLMVTHSMHQALKLGTRTVMLHQGKIVYDVRGQERQQLTIPDLLKKFGDSLNDEFLLDSSKA